MSPGKQQQLPIISQDVELPTHSTGVANTANQDTGLGHEHAKHVDFEPFAAKDNDTVLHLRRRSSLGSILAQEPHGHSESIMLEMPALDAFCLMHFCLHGSKRCSAHCVLRQSLAVSASLQQHHVSGCLPNTFLTLYPLCISVFMHARDAQAAGSQQLATLLPPS